jgi:uncharacterized membrane protein (UPF0182 family)
MMYNDKVGYGPTVSDALDELFGAGAGATATGPAPVAGGPGSPPAAPQANGQPPAAPPPGQEGRAPEVPTPVAAVPGGGAVQLSAAKAAALQDVNSALDGLRTAQQSGNFAQYGQALQKLDDAVAKYQAAK